jgi:hypothetical protein
MGVMFFGEPDRVLTGMKLPFLDSVITRLAFQMSED